MAKKILMGLDLGTDSVGWCVADEGNHIMKKGGKSLWGVRLFDEAEDCQARRANRIARRRTVRRAYRIDLLQSLFAEGMQKVDPTFFIRMNNSSLLEKDKDTAAQGTDGTLFAGIGGLTDAKYHQTYKTIYHLRKALMEQDGKADLRLIYLALHHMIKYRGNFLHYGETISLKGNDLVAASFASIDPSLAELGYREIGLDEAKTKACLDILLNARGINDAKHLLTDCFGSDDPFVKGCLIPLLAGGTIQTSKLFSTDEDEEIDPKTICVREADFEGAYAKLESAFASRAETHLIKAAKEISDFVLMKKLLGSETSLSGAMVALYEKHQKELKELKKYIRDHCKEKYDLVFRDYDAEKANYVRYVGMVDKGGQRIRYEHCSREDFYAFLKKEIFGVIKGAVIEDKRLQEILSEMDDGTYLPRQNSTDNGVFPYQLNLSEMTTILHKQSRYYPFLKAVDVDGYVTSDKIVSILTYHIPYYVGPLMAQKEGDKRCSHAWVVRTNEKITPWNFNSGVIDFDQSAENFIQRMLNKCTYLPGHYCLPKSSLLYSRYELVAFLNNIRINGKEIPAHSSDSDPVSKDSLIADLFSKGNVTKRSLVDYLKKVYGHFDASLLTYAAGKPIDEIHCSLKSYADFSQVLGRNYVESHMEQVEAIIRDLTIFTDRGIVERRLRNKYGFKDESVIYRLKNISYQGFGRFSKELLELKSPCLNKDTGEITDITLLDYMYESGRTFMEAINDSSLTYGKQINEAQAEFAPTLEESENKLDQVKAAVDDLYVSPSLKRPLLQAYEIIDEVQKILGRPVDEYYVECTRGEDKKSKGKPKESRLDSLLGIYEKAVSDSRAWLNEINKKSEPSAGDLELKAQIVNNQAALNDCLSGLKKCKDSSSDLRFRSDKLFLYYAQLGRCMYSLEPIDIDALFADQERYDIDHIVPQSLVKDDSIENRVLVSQDYNRKKKDSYPLPSGFLAPGAKSFYLYLRKIGLIGDKKLSALMRSPSDQLSDDELAAFENRQLVSTNQAVIGLINIIEKFEAVPGHEPEVIYSKAGLVSDFRSKFDVLKSREANDFHHAHDAYLNIIVGRANHEYFRYMTGRGWFEMMHRNKMTTNPNNIFDDVSSEQKEKGITKRIIKDKDGNICWDSSSSLQEIKKNIYERFDILVTVRAFIKPGLFNKVSIHKKGDWKGNNLFPVKKGMNPADYGGYCDLTNGFFALLLLKDKKGKEYEALLPIPNIYSGLKDGETVSSDRILDYAKNVVKLNVIKVLVPCIRVNTLIELGKSKYRITGKHTNDDSVAESANEMIFSKDQISTIRAVTKLNAIISGNRKFGLDPQKDDFDAKLGALLGISPDQKQIVISPAANESKNKAVILTAKEETDLYNCLIGKLASELFDGISVSQNVCKFASSAETKAKFESLSLAKRAIVLNELLKSVKAHCSENPSLLLLGGSSKTGQRLIRNALKSGSVIIVQSVTGFYDKVLWKVK
jgi:CRISPR-associated endonuclease Csn1